jgi:hypothetical protein
VRGCRRPDLDSTTVPTYEAGQEDDLGRVQIRESPSEQKERGERETVGAYGSEERGGETGSVARIGTTTSR